MVTTCSAIGCSERAKKGNKTTFHRFPTRPQLREQWVKALKRANFQVTPNSRICEKHFKPECFLTLPNGRKALKNNSVPDIFDFSAYISKTDRYRARKTKILEPSENVVEKPDISVDSSPPINCIQFVDVNSLPCDVPSGSKRTLIVIKSDNKRALEDFLPKLINPNSLKNVQDPCSPKYEHTYLQQLNNSVLPQNIQTIISKPPSTESPKIVSTFSISGSKDTSPDDLNTPTPPSDISRSIPANYITSLPVKNSNDLSALSTNSSDSITTISKPIASNTVSSQPIAQPISSGSQAGLFKNTRPIGAEFLKSRYMGDFTTFHLTNKWGRLHFLCKVKELKQKYRDRLRTMLTIRKQLNRRKAFLENLLIRIKEKQLTSDEDALDLMDCFVEEESLDSDDESSASDDTAETLTNLIDDKIMKMTNHLNRDCEPHVNECQLFAVNVDSLISVMSEENAIQAKNRIKELINAHKGKKLVQLSKLGGYFPGLENIEIE